MLETSQDTSASNPATPAIPTFSYERWTKPLPELAKTYQANSPFPHIHLKEFLEKNVAERVLADFPGPDDIAWFQYRHLNSKKLGCTDLSLFSPAIQATVKELQSPRFLDWLSALTGIPNLIADPSMEGGGLHQSVAGGFLNIHADFNRHYRHPEWKRRLNLLVYLNPDWQDGWNGELELWDRGMKKCESKIPPLFNDAVIFSTDDTSFHGHPVPLKCPVGVTRKSIALYYFTRDDRTDLKAKPTNYQVRPEDGALKGAFLRFDKQALGVYHILRMKLNISDGFMSKLLKPFNRK